MHESCGILVGRLKERDYSEEVGIGGKIILEWMLGR
jgi:hypothetical protein